MITQTKVGMCRGPLTFDGGVFRDSNGNDVGNLQHWRPEAMRHAAHATQVLPELIEALEKAMEYVPDVTMNQKVFGDDVMALLSRAKSQPEPTEGTKP